METLVLSHAFEPVARVSWQRAVTLLFAGKVEVVEEYEDRTVRSVTLELKVPSIVRFLRRVRWRRPAVKLSRESVYARDGGACQYCGARLSRPEATWDHVVPRSRGGATTWENVVLACVACNQRKGGRTPAEAGMRLRAVPGKPTRPADAVRLTFTSPKDVPASWRQWLVSFHYWNGALEEDAS